MLKDVLVMYIMFTNFPADLISLTIHLYCINSIFLFIFVYGICIVST